MRGAWTKAAMLALAAGLGAGPAAGQPAPGAAAGPEGWLADTVRLGGVAALAPICGLRDEGWAADLRRAAIRAAARPDARDGPGRKAAPGDLAAGALSFAEAEALESLAQAPEAETCGPLAASPDLDRADRAVLEFRAETGITGPGS